MDRETLLHFIEEKGFRTRDELKKEFDDTEIMDSHLANLIGKNHLVCVEFKKPDGQKGRMYCAKYL